MRIRQSLPTAIHTPDRNAGLLEGAVAGSNPGARAAAECRETGGGDVREETWGEMPVEESWAAMEARRYC